MLVAVGEPRMLEPNPSRMTYEYDLLDKQATHTDFNGNAWTTIDNACCVKQRASKDPLGHGTSRNSDSSGRSVHSITVSDLEKNKGVREKQKREKKTCQESLKKTNVSGVIDSTVRQCDG